MIKTLWLFQVLLKHANLHFMVDKVAKLFLLFLFNVELRIFIGIARGNIVDGLGAKDSNIF